MNLRWVYIMVGLAVVAVLGGCQGTSALRLMNLPMRDLVTVAPVVNATGLSLPLPPDNLMAAIRQEFGISDEAPVTVPDVLHNRFVLAFQTHGYQVTQTDKAPQVFSDRSMDIVKVVEEARAAGFKGVIVLPTLRRWDDSKWISLRAVFVAIDITLARVSDGKILDAGALRDQAVPVGAATTILQATDDAARWLSELLF